MTTRPQASRRPVKPFRLTAPVVPEAELQRGVVALLTIVLLPPAFFFSAAFGACKLSPQQAAALSRAGVKRGLPDLMILAPGDGHARIFGIELKRFDIGRLSKTRIVRTRRGSPRVLEGQEDVFPALEKCGMKIAVCRSADEVLDTLQMWQIPLRGRLGVPQ